MTLAAIFAASLFMGFSGAIMPGPLLTVTINESLRQGPWTGPKLVVGHALLELLLVILILLGLGPAFTLPLVKAIIGLVGGGFLLWMGYGILRESLSKRLSLDLDGKDGTPRLHPVLTGITVSASNPYWSIWWATAGAGSLMLALSHGPGGAISFYSGHILSDFIWYSLVSTAVAKGKKLFTPLIYRLILGICGVFLLGLALYFMYSGLSFLRL